MRWYLAGIFSWLYGHVIQHHQRTSSQQFYNLLYNKFATSQCQSQSCSLGLDVSVSRRTRDVFFKRLGLVSVSAKCGKVSVSVSSRTASQTSRSRLGLGPQRLVYKWAFKQIFQFLSFLYETNMSDIIFLFIHSLVLYVFPFR